MAGADEVVVVRPRLGEVDDDQARLYVVGYDPGVTTGWAVLRLDLGELMRGGFAALALKSGGGRDPRLFAWDCGEFTGPENHQVDQMVGLVRGVWEDGVFDAGPDSDVAGPALEGFTLRMMSMDAGLLAPVRLLATFSYAAREVPVPRVVQSPSDAKSVVTDDRLRAMNMWMPGSEHRRDATRHAVLLARKMSDPAFLARWHAACAWLR